MVIDIDDPVMGAYGVNTEQLVQINNEAWANQWSGCWSDVSELLKAVDPDGQHVIVPVLHTGGADPTSPPALRCYVWYRAMGSNKRECTLIDVSAGMLATLHRLEGSALERLVVLLFAELPLTRKS